jgi:hypothetical protein
VIACSTVDYKQTKNLLAWPFSIRVKAISTIN